MQNLKEKTTNDCERQQEFLLIAGLGAYTGETLNIVHNYSLLNEAVQLMASGCSELDEVSGMATYTLKHYLLTILGRVIKMVDKE